MKIDEWEKHLYFLASFQMQNGKVNYIKEIFPDAKFGDIRG